MDTASWVIRRRTTGEVLFETFSAKVVRHLNTEQYEAVPILQYLQEFNRRVRAASQNSEDTSGQTYQVGDTRQAVRAKVGPSQNTGDTDHE